MNIFLRGMALLSLTFFLSFCAGSKAPGLEAPNSDYENTELGDFLKDKIEASREEIKAVARFHNTSRGLNKTFDSSTSNEDWEKGVELWNVFTPTDKISLYAWTENTTDIQDTLASQAVFTAEGKEIFISPFTDASKISMRIDLDEQPASIGTKNLYYLVFKKSSAPGKEYYVELPPITLNTESQP